MMAQLLWLLPPMQETWIELAPGFNLSLWGANQEMESINLSLSLPLPLP